jgi:hypothetical protein
MLLTIEKSKPAAKPERPASERKTGMTAEVPNRCQTKKLMVKAASGILR